MVAAGTGLKLKQAQQALFVLMQHLLVRARTEVDPRHQRTLVWYTLDVDALLARLHYAQFLAEALRYFGREVRRSSALSALSRDAYFPALTIYRSGLRAPARRATRAPRWCAR